MNVRSLLSRKKPQIFVLLVSLVASLILIPGWGLPSFGQTTGKASIQFVSPEWVTANAKDPNLRVLDVRTAPLAQILHHSW
jgi:thiosulfate/3-mercaptopyruvate sulfurtransferase